MEHLDEMLNRAEQEAKSYGDAFEIFIVRKISGMKAPLQVYPANTLEQVLAESAKLIGVNTSYDKIYYVNEKTGANTTDKKKTIAEMGLGPSDTLLIVDSGGVAAC